MFITRISRKIFLIDIRVNNTCDLHTSRSSNFNLIHLSYTIQRQKEIYISLNFSRNNLSSIPNIHPLQTFPFPSHQIGALDLKVGIQENFLNHLPVEFVFHAILIAFSSLRLLSRHAAFIRLARENSPLESSSSFSSSL